ncbi:unnamed protein product [Trichobilharzia regenti]|nr:unnamed protein product [Trichobilharzia regenti]
MWLSRKLSTQRAVFCISLALAYGIRRFHKMLCSRRFILLTLQTPVPSIFVSETGLPVHSANRLQRWVVIPLRYDFGHTDALSRLISGRPWSKEESVIEIVKTETFVENLSALSVEQLATRRDATLEQAMQFVRTSWPVSVLSDELNQSFRCCYGLSMVNECLMLEERIVIPVCVLMTALKQFHSGRLRIVLMKFYCLWSILWLCVS